MSAAPRPQTEEVQPSGDAEGWALLDGMRRRLDEQANQHRKTQAQVTQLAESIGALVATHRRRTRWLNINSFVAYLIFTMLCGGAFYLLYQSRARELLADRARVAQDRDTAQAAKKQLTEQIGARDAADAKALEAYQLLETGTRRDAAKKLEELTGAPLSKLERNVLDTRAKQAEVTQVDATIKATLAAFKTGRHADVIAQLEEALTLESTGPRAAMMHYYLGIAYAKSGALDKGISQLQLAVDSDVDEEDARFHLASALDRAGLWGKARGEYERFATAHPMSSYTAFATRRAATLSRSPDVAPASTMPAGAAQPAQPKAATATTPPAAAPQPAPKPAQPAAKPAQPAAKPAQLAPKPAQPAAKPAQPATPPVKTLDFSEPD